MIEEYTLNMMPRTKKATQINLWNKISIEMKDYGKKSYIRWTRLLRFIQIQLNSQLMIMMSTDHDEYNYITILAAWFVDWSICLKKKILCYELKMDIFIPKMVTWLELKYSILKCFGEYYFNLTEEDLSISIDLNIFKYIKISSLLDKLCINLSGTALCWLNLKMQSNGLERSKRYRLNWSVPLCRRVSKVHNNEISSSLSIFVAALHWKKWRKKKWEEFKNKPQKRGSDVDKVQEMLSVPFVLSPHQKWISCVCMEICIFSFISLVVFF